MTQFYVIWVVVAVGLFDFINARPSSHINNGLDIDSHNMGADSHDNKPNTNIAKRAIIIFDSPKNCQKLDHSGKCLDNKRIVTKKKTDMHKTNSKTTEIPLYDENMNNQSVYDSLTDDVPIISHTIAEFHQAHHT